MAQLIAIASGKGGVGKSFCSSNLAMSLNSQGYKVLLVDVDLGGANLHNFVGLKVPGVGLYNFIRDKAKLSDVIVSSPSGVDFVSGSGDVLGMANISKYEKMKIVVNLKSSDYDYIIMDLGAGTSFNTIDIFNIADTRIIVMNGEPTSIENSYGFLKVAIFRHIERLTSNRWDLEEVNKKLRSKSMNFPSVQAIIDIVKGVDSNLAKNIEDFIISFTPCMILNMVKYKRELNVFHGFTSVVKKYLNVDIVKLGFIPYNEEISESIKLLKPFYKEYTNSDVISCIDDVRTQLLSNLK